jgi:hypothetical protein
MTTTQKFFFYGTLIDPGVRRAVLGGKAPKRVEEAILLGWRRRRAERATFPVVVADGRAKTPGVLAHDVTPEAKALLDAYEGKGYRAESWVVERADGKRLQAMVYVPDGSNAVRAGAEAWDYEEWRTTHKAAFLARLKTSKTAPRGR